MHRAVPSVNKFLSKKWNDIEQDIHQKKLRQIKESSQFIFNEYSSSRVNKKKLAQKKERYKEIERTNRILMDKMTHIYKKNHTTTFSSSDLNSSKKSLNSSSRKKQLLKITIENQKILERLQKKRSQYRVSVWNKQEKEREKLLNNICEYPYKLKRDKGFSQYSIQDDDSNESIRTQSRNIIKGNLPTIDRNTIFHGDSGRHIPKFLRKNGKIVPLSSNIKAKLADPDKQILYQDQQKIKNHNCKVEISLIHDNLFLIAYDLKSGDTHVIEIPQRKVHKFMAAYENNYERITSHLQFLDNKLVIPFDEKGSYVNERKQGLSIPKISKSRNILDMNDTKRLKKHNSVKRMRENYGPIYEVIHKDKSENVLHRMSNKSSGRRSCNSGASGVSEGASLRNNSRKGATIEHHDRVKDKEKDKDKENTYSFSDALNKHSAQAD